jgi:hypothetical protein
VHSLQAEIPYPEYETGMLSKGIFILFGGVLQMSLCASETSDPIKVQLFSA